MIEALSYQFIKYQDEHIALEILRFLRSNGRHYIGMTLGELFSSIFPHSKDIMDEWGINTFYCKKYEKSYDIYKKLLDFKGLNYNESFHILSNNFHNIKEISDRYNYYNSEIVNQLSAKKTDNFPSITFTITTCKRFDLFTQTINTFLNCCSDIHLIDKWICIDDNSSTEDRSNMQKLYPFFTFYWKSVEEKGHPQSMNIIRKVVETPYIFHMEDDWKFFEKRNYISELLEVLGTQNNIMQCLINKNYGEKDSDINIKGGDFRVTNTGTRYIVHEWVNNDNSREKWDNKHGTGPHCNYWPHFSFRPSLFKRSIFDRLGSFNEKISHFEMEYSEKYARAGYESAFLEGIYCLHIGRLTSERHDKSKQNAYTLNNEAQFEGKEEKLSVQQETQQPKSNLFNTDNLFRIQISNFDRRIETFVINLNRRPDRWNTFSKNAKESGLDFLQYTRFSAVDGSKLVSTRQLQRIFENNDYNMRRGMVGCALSHLKLYTQLLNSDDSDIYIILEDDIEFTDNFSFKLLYIYNQLKEHDWDMVYLGHHCYSKYINNDTYNKIFIPAAEKWSKQRSLTESIGGTGGYMITKRGAEKLLEFLNETGMTNGIDTVQQKSADICNVYYTLPHLIYSKCWRNDSDNDNTLDTDIQYDYSSLSRSSEIRMLDEIKYFQKPPKFIHSEDEALHLFSTYTEASSSNSVNNYIYVNEEEKGVYKVKSLCKYPCYDIDNKYLFVVKIPGNYHCYFHRFKIGNSWSIDDAIQYLNE